MPVTVRLSKKCRPPPPPPEPTDRSRRKKAKRAETRLDDKRNADSSQNLRPLPETLTRSNDRSKRTLETPVTRSSTNNDMPSNPVDRIGVLRRRIGEEIEDRVTMYEDDWVKNEFQSLASDADLDAFLNKPKRPEQIWNKRTKRWTGLASRTKSEQAMYPHIERLVNALIEELAKIEADSGVSREAVIRDRKRMVHVENDPKAKHFTMPDIVIRAEGKSFEIPASSKEGTDAVGYSNISSFIEVKLDISKSGGPSDSELTDQVGVYAR